MIKVLTAIKNLSSYTLLLEIVDTTSLKFYKDLGFGEEILDPLEKNLGKKKNPEGSMTFYGNFFGGEKLVAFFPKKDSLLDDRCDTLRKIDKNTIFIPSREVSLAYEAMVLSTYSYDRFLTKKTEKSHAIYVPTKEKKKIEEQKPLLEAIIRARDIINLPPTDTRPEEFVKHITNFPWKKFTLRVIDAEELKKLGCNLLLAV
jgi:hypothetical protein